MTIICVLSAPLVDRTQIHNNDLEQLIWRNCASMDFVEVLKCGRARVVAVSIDLTGAQNVLSVRYALGTLD